MTPSIKLDRNSKLRQIHRAGQERFMGQANDTGSNVKFVLLWKEIIFFWRRIYSNEIDCLRNLHQRFRYFLEKNGWRNVVDARAWAFREGESRLPTSFLFASFYLSRRQCWAGMCSLRMGTLERDRVICSESFSFAGEIARAKVSTGLAKRKGETRHAPRRTQTGEKDF